MPNGDEFGEIIGDTFIIAFGIILVYIFVTIEVLGSYGQEPNKVVLLIEKYIGLPILLLGINRLIQDFKRRK